MADRTVARRYAGAFIDVAVEHGVIDRLLGDLERLLTIVRAHDDRLLGALSKPVFRLEERRSVLQDVLQRAAVSGLTRNLALLLLDKGRFAALPDVVDIYRELADAKAGRARVVVETAEPLSPQLEAEVRAALEKVTGKSVILDLHVNTDLIGGMVARVGGTVYDASVRARLNQLRQKLLSSPLLGHPPLAGTAEA